MKRREDHFCRSIKLIDVSFSRGCLVSGHEFRRTIFKVAGDPPRGGGGGGVLPYKGLMGTCGQPGYVFRDFCLKQGIEFIIFCLHQGIDLSIFVLNRMSFLGR